MHHNSSFTPYTTPIVYNILYTYTQTKMEMSHQIMIEQKNLLNENNKLFQDRLKVVEEKLEVCIKTLEELGRITSLLHRIAKGSDSNSESNNTRQ